MPHRECTHWTYESDEDCYELLRKYQFDFPVVRRECGLELNEDYQSDDPADWYHFPKESTND